MVKIAGYWPSSFFVCLWIKTESRSINSRRSKSNVRKSNSIELNPWIEFDYGRQSNEIEHHTFSEFDFRTNRIQLNKSNSIELNRTQSVWLSSIEFGNRTQSNTIKWISFDCLWWIYTKKALSKPVKASFSRAFFTIYSITQTQFINCPRQLREQNKTKLSLFQRAYFEIAVAHRPY